MYLYFIVVGVVTADSFLAEFTQKHMQSCEYKIKYSHTSIQEYTQYKTQIENIGVEVHIRCYKYIKKYKFYIVVGATGIIGGPLLSVL